MLCVRFQVLVLLEEVGKHDIFGVTKFELQSLRTETHRHVNVLAGIVAVVDTSREGQSQREGKTNLCPLFHLERLLFHRIKF